MQAIATRIDTSSSWRSLISSGYGANLVGARIRKLHVQDYLYVISEEKKKDHLRTLWFSNKGDGIASLTDLKKLCEWHP